MEQQGERRTAVKVLVREIIEGNFFHEEGWNPNYLDTLSGKRVYKVNIVGVIVAVVSEEDACYIDDGSGTILIRNYTDAPLNFKTGDFGLVIGRVRESGAQRYVSSEITKKIHPSWVTVRRKELESAFSKISLPVSSSLDTPADLSQQSSAVLKGKNFEFEHIVSFLQKNDSGVGVSVEVLLESGIVESSLQELLKNGTIYQNKPGYVQLIG